MINLIPPEIDFLEILGITKNEIKEIFDKSENENDFIDYLDVDECIRQLDLHEHDSIELKNSIIYFCHDVYKQYDLLGRIK